MSYRRVRRLEFTIPSLRDPRGVPVRASRRRGDSELANDVPTPTQHQVRNPSKLPSAAADRVDGEQDAPKADRGSDCGNRTGVERWLNDIARDPADEVHDYRRSR